MKYTKITLQAYFKVKIFKATLEIRVTLICNSASIFFMQP